MKVKTIDVCYSTLKLSIFTNKSIRFKVKTAEDIVDVTGYEPKIRNKRDHHLFSYLSPRSFVNNEVKLDRIINFLNISYNILNSNSGNTNLDKLTAALFRLSSSQGYFAALNYLFTVSNIAQTYGGIISGIALKDSKKKHKEDSISGMEVADRLQSSVDELNDRLSSTSEIILKLFYCTY